MSIRRRFIALSSIGICNGIVRTHLRDKKVIRLKGKVSHFSFNDPQSENTVRTVVFFTYPKKILLSVFHSLAQ